MSSNALATIYHPARNAGNISDADDAADFQSDCVLNFEECEYVTNAYVVDIGSYYDQTSFAYSHTWSHFEDDEGNDFARDDGLACGTLTVTWDGFMMFSRVSTLEFVILYSVDAGATWRDMFRSFDADFNTFSSTDLEMVTTSLDVCTRSNLRVRINFGGAPDYEGVSGLEYGGQFFIYDIRVESRTPSYFHPGRW
jgi:hypothetical protein